MLSFACLLCRESRGAFDMCLTQQSLIFHSKKCYTKESHSLVKSTFLTLHSLHSLLHSYIFYCNSISKDIRIDIGKTLKYIVYISDV